MTNDSIVNRSRVALKVVAVLGLVLGQGGCGLNDVDIPSFDGPSEMANALRLTVTPDVITADGFSTAFVQAELRDQNAQPLANRDILFAIADNEGRFADIGTLYDLAGNRLGATEATIRTNAQGLAQIIYKAPPRTDATANQSILIFGRPVGTDFDGQFYRTVRLELRSAEPRLFPQDPGNIEPLCSFVVEMGSGRAGSSILFQSTSSDPDGTIVRYEWFFGDGTGVVYFPDTNHIFRFPGSYTVTHIVTDDDGAQKACAATVTVF
jgi:PKD domain